MASPALQGVGDLTGANAIPFDDEGHTYHFGCRAGDVSNAVLLVSDYHLAKRFADHFETTRFLRHSNRGYDTYTGTYKGTELSIVGFGIGFAMIDFLIRELRAVTDGPLTFIHIGTASSPANLPLGTAVIVRDAVAYQPDFANWSGPCPHQIFANPVPSASAVVAAIEAGLRFIQVPHVFGRAASTNSFATGLAALPAPAGIDFKNGALLQRLTDACGEIATLEMDIYPLLWMSRRATGEEIWSGSVSLVGSNFKGEVLPDADIESRLVEIAKVMLAQLAALKGAR